MPPGSGSTRPGVRLHRRLTPGRLRLHNVHVHSRLLYLLLILLAPCPAFAEGKILVSAPSKSLTWFPAALAKERGFYRDEGLDVDFVVMNPRLALQAVISGDATYTTALGSTIRAAVRGVPLRVVLTICEKPHFALIAKRGIASIEQLKGKIVGISSFGASSDTMARAALLKYKLSPEKDVKILAVGGGLTTCLDRVHTHTGEVQRMVRAALRAIQFAKTNRRDTVAAIAKWTGMDAKLADGSYDMAAPT